MWSDWPGSADLIILDEIHKYKKWKSFVKGEYDILPLESGLFHISIPLFL